jgi:hypothetical protein
MSIPQKVDKWIVFIVAIGLGAADAYRSRGVDAIDGFAIATALALIITIVYLIWCAACRLLTRLRGVRRIFGNMRIFANIVFVAFVSIALFWPVPRWTVTIPAKAILKSSAPDAGPSRTAP